ncbi:AAA family ATPase [uncultured Bradyrhizobium sp.]|uniref:ATP-dependent nuclease n=2 Tax=Bradyrhizobium TaxID=374 RepID=UPI002607E6F8|nr:AAA family ATPase [uncultured Bradyrhizobium sp.]
MQFTVIPYSRSSRAERDIAGGRQCFLVADNWDDYSYKTAFSLVYLDGDGTRHDIGAVKIMRRSMSHGYTQIEDGFVALGQEYASLGQSQEYYENLIAVDEEDRIAILEALQDVVWNDDIFAAFQNEAVFETSLLRSVSARELTKLRTIAHEQAMLTPFHFRYKFPESDDAVIEVQVTPNAVPPTNIHAIIGRNGVGKTTLLRSISTLLRVGRKRSLGRLTFITDDDELSGEEGFANLVTVAFSAFDEFDPAIPNDGTATGLQYAYIGLKKNVRLKSGRREARNKTTADLRADFVASTLKCLRSSRKPRWRSAMRVLEGDPLFAALRLERLADLPQDDFEDTAVQLFDEASSGHKIVLLTMTRLVELVSEGTLVLIDEPEAHLHPPLAASFVRALSGLLAQRNGVAILATHSPVIVQEVPSNCVSLFFRDGASVEIERPEVETFAENVGLLTREIFRVEFTESGYHALISDVVSRSNTFDQALAAFEGHLGAEGRALVRALWEER